MNRRRSWRPTSSIFSSACRNLSSIVWWVSPRAWTWQLPRPSPMTPRPETKIAALRVVKTREAAREMIHLSVYHEKAAISSAIAEKRKMLRSLYGGMMSVTDLMDEFGYKSEESAKRAIRDMGVEPTKIGRSKKYDTDTVARRLVELRGSV